MTSRERAAHAHYPAYFRSNATDLYDVYSRCSAAKRHAWDYCRKLCLDKNGRGLRIISGNSFMFTAGFEFPDPETGVRMFMYITPNYDVAVEV